MRGQDWHDEWNWQKHREVEGDEETLVFGVKEIPTAGTAWNTGTLGLRRLQRHWDFCRHHEIGTFVNTKTLGLR